MKRAIIDKETIETVELDFWDELVKRPEQISLRNEGDEDLLNDLRAEFLKLQSDLKQMCELRPECIGKYNQGFMDAMQILNKKAVKLTYAVLK